MRRLSTLAGHLAPTTASVPAGGKATPVSDDLKAFMDAFRGLSKDLVDDAAHTHGQPPYIQEWLRRVSDMRASFFSQLPLCSRVPSCCTTRSLAAR